MLNILSLIVSTVISIYSLSFQDVEGNQVSMNNFHGKKILIVNTATGNDAKNQIMSLKQLQAANRDSLVVILFPSNSFGSENLSDTQVKEYYKNTIGFDGIIAAKSNVAGPAINSVFSWLTQKSQNGEANAIVTSDFQKFLISSRGEIIGYFSSKVDPLDADLVAAIRRPF